MKTDLRLRLREQTVTVKRCGFMTTVHKCLNSVMGKNNTWNPSNVSSATQILPQNSVQNSQELKCVP